MKIVHVLYSFGTGGMEKGVAALVEHASPGFDHVIVCLSRAGESRRLVPSGTKFVELNKAPGHSFAFWFRLAAELRELRPDVVHTRNWAGLDGVVACRIGNIRTVVHGEHGWSMEDPDGMNRMRIRVRRFLSRWVREYTCVSEQMVSWLRDTICVGTRVTQVYNGVDPSRYRPPESPGRIRSELGIGRDAFVVSICGRLDPIKDHPTLFRAFEVLRQQHPDSYLVVIGDGPERDNLTRAAGANVRFLGDRTDVPEILGDSDVFSLVSLNEGISNTVLEAMAVGLPVIVTEVGGNPDLVDHEFTGILIPPRDERALLSALETYLHGANIRREHGLAARRKMLQQFSVGSMVKKYEEVYSRTGVAIASR